MSETTWHDVHVKAGDNWAVEVELSDANGNPYDMTDIVPRMQVRDSVGAAAVRFDLEVGSGITVNTETGTVRCEIGRADTAGILPSAKPRYFYADLELYREGPPAWSITPVSIRWVVDAKVTNHE